LREAKLTRERIFGKLASLRAKEQVDGPSDGLAERMANLNRGIATADDRNVEFEAAIGLRHRWQPDAS